MAAKCTICGDPRRPEAEALIAAGVSVRQAAKQTGLSYQSLDRHQRNCARQAIVKAAESREVALGSSILDRVEDLQTKTMQLYEDARNGRVVQLPNGETLPQVPDATAARLALGTARKNLELIARLTGQLDPQENTDRRGVTWEQFERIIFERRKKTEVRP